MAFKDIEKGKKYNREYYKNRYVNDSKFREKRKKYMRDRYASDPEKIKKFMREYMKSRYASDPEYREKIKKRDREYYKNLDTSNPKYRERQREADQKCYVRRRKETPWVLHWKAARNRCNNSNATGYKYYGGKGVRFLLTKLEIEILYKCSHADQMVKPSIDRIDSNGDYSFENCHFIEQSENSRRGHLKQRRKTWRVN